MYTDFFFHIQTKMQGEIRRFFIIKIPKLHAQ